MEFKDQLVYCNKCANKKFDFKTGVICSLTESKPNFEGTCNDFLTSDLEKQKENAKEYTKKLNNESHNFKNDFSKSKNENQLIKERQAFLNELKDSESSNTPSYNNNSKSSPWKVVLSVIIAIIALVRLIIALV